MKRIFYYSLIVIALWGCGQKQTAKLVEKNGLCTIDVNNLENLSGKDFIEKVAVIPLETNSNCLIGKIDKFNVYNDKIWILDKSIAKALFVFNMEGKYFTRIGKIGKGPGEYMDELNDFFIDSVKKQVVLLTQLGEVIKYDLNGNFIDRKRFDINYPQYVWGTADGYLFNVSIVCNSFKKNGIAYKVFETDENLNVKQYYFPQDIFDAKMIPFDWGEQLFCQGSEAFFRKNFTDTIYKYENGAMIAHTCFSTKETVPYQPLITEAYVNKKHSIGLYKVHFINNDYLIATYSRKERDVVGLFHSYKTGRTYTESDTIPLLPYPFKPEYACNGLIYGHLSMLEVKEFTEMTIEYGKKLNLEQSIIDTSKDIHDKLKINDNPYILAYTVKDI